MKAILQSWEPSDPQCRTIRVPYWRLHDLLFMPGPVPSSDVAASYCADKLGMAGDSPARLSKFVLHEGLRYVNTGGSETECTLYQLHPATPGLTIQPKPGERTHNGQSALLLGKPYVLCRPIRFAAIDPTLEEARWRLRQMFAHGGFFALKHKTYEPFLRDWKEKRELYASAARAELAARRKLPKTREAMQKLCLTDPLWLDKPWAKVPAPARGRPKFDAATTAEDQLAAMLAKL